ncbi:efflux RND transporter periplasmic adaptor subunit [Cardiobacterium valvarum]|uniref:Macrolide-specific efflux protein macA n=1 Tax=Cardiobacterium valvarum TaxID=194702 RepID=A0A381EE95_9GAMM|nr:efflux RND transporter periplasmic adaptor subunit [Cardiobacterium valvarum]SUX25338.1 Macrolide-specific efflux protein macA precursor [Cardiobacterium valvarum]
MLRQQFGRVSLKFLFFLLVLGAGGFWYWQASRKPADDDGGIKYITAPVAKGDIAHTVLASGSLQPLKSVKVGAQVSGEISALYVQIGDQLKQGDPVAEIDASTQQNTRDSAAASLASSKAALTSAQAKLREAQQNFNRQQSLVKKGAAAQETLDTAQATLKAAQSSVEQAKADIRRNQLELDNAGLRLGYTNVTAPMDGVVISVAVEKGQTVNAVQDSPTLATIAQTKTMTVEAEIAEADVGELKPGMNAYFTLLGSDKTRYEGKLKSIDPAPLATSKNTASNSSSGSSETAVYYYGKMDVPNPDGKLRIGMTANMVISVEEAKDVITIPMTALQTNAQGEDEVQVMVGGKPQPRVVKLGINDGVNTEVKEGLQVGEEVVISSGSGEGSIPMGPGGPF